MGQSLQQRASESPARASPALSPRFRDFETLFDTTLDADVSCLFGPPGPLFRDDGHDEIDRAVFGDMGANKEPNVVALVEEHRCMYFVYAMAHAAPNRQTPAAAAQT